MGAEAGLQQGGGLQRPAGGDLKAHPHAGGAGWRLPLGGVFGIAGGCARGGAQPLFRRLLGWLVQGARHRPAPARYARLHRRYPDGAAQVHRQGEEQGGAARAGAAGAGRAEAAAEDAQGGAHPAGGPAGDAEAQPRDRRIQGPLALGARRRAAGSHRAARAPRAAGEVPVIARAPRRARLEPARLPRPARAGLCPLPGAHHPRRQQRVRAAGHQRGVIEPARWRRAGGGEAGGHRSAQFIGRGEKEREPSRWRMGG